MASGVNGQALRQIRTLFETGAIGGLTDGQLLERFRAWDGDAGERAFTALVERHGPMVLRVCRRCLLDEHDAQDAFQATFLVLVRKAGSFRVDDSLGPWLHAVACNVAACARSARARRKSHERRVAETVSPRVSARNGGWDDLGPVLHEEIGKLPEAYRTAVVLCDLEGLTQEQAAHRLGWPPGTVRSRLARGRVRLRARLTRRGLAPSAGGLVTLLTAETANATAAVPAALMGATARAATLAAAGRTTAGAVALLSNRVLRTMLMTKLKLISATLLMVGAGAGGTAVIAFQQGPGPSGSPIAQGRDTRGHAESPALARHDTGTSEAALAELERERDVTLAKMDLERAEARLEWAKRMSEKGYVSKTQVNDDEQSVVRARFALKVALAKQELARTTRRGGERPDKTVDERNSTAISLLKATLDETKRPSDTLDQASRKVVDARISLAESDLKRAEDRFSWASRMFLKGYVAKPQMLADLEKYEAAKAALRLAREGREPRAQELPPEDKATGEIKREIDNLEGYVDKAQMLARLVKREQDEVALKQAREGREPRVEEPPPPEDRAIGEIKREIDNFLKSASKIKHELRNDFRTALIQLLRSLRQIETTEDFRRDNGPERSSEAEWKVIEAEKAVAIADCRLQVAKLKLIAVRSDQSK